MPAVRRIVQPRFELAGDLRAQFRCRLLGEGDRGDLLRLPDTELYDIAVAADKDACLAGTGVGGHCNVARRVVRLLLVEREIGHGSIDDAKELGEYRGKVGEVFQ